MIDEDEEVDSEEAYSEYTNGELLQHREVRSQSDHECSLMGRCCSFSEFQFDQRNRNICKDHEVLTYTRFQRSRSS